MNSVNKQTLYNKINRVSEEIAVTTDNIKINNIVEDFVTALVDAEFCSLWFYDAQSMQLLRERDHTLQRTISLDEKKGIIYKCFMTQKAKVYNYLASDKDYVAHIDNPDNIKIRSKVIVPLFHEKKLIGIVTVYNSIKKTKKFTLNDIETLQSLETFLVNALAKMHGFSVKPNKEIKTHTRTPKETQEENSDETLGAIANFVHDIKTPINTLHGFLELLEGQIEDKRLKEYLLNAKESANFINDLTHGMLDRISFHRERSNTEEQEIDTILFFINITNMYTSNMYTKQIKFNVFIDPLLPKTMIVESMKLKRVLMNLISNAYKFTPYGKSIDVSIAYNQKTKSIDIAVKDRGIGIAKEKQKQIFEAFQQADDATQLQYGGSGLGLAISSTYVKDLGGQLRVKSEEEKGALFYFSFPLKTKKEEPSYQAVQNPKAKIAILFSANNNTSLLNIVKHLTRLKFDTNSIVTCTSLESIPEDTTHLIVYQHQMNDMLTKKMHQFEKILVVEEELFSITNDTLSDKYMLISEYGAIVHELNKFINSVQIRKILLVDDDKTSILLLERILESEFCEIEVARNGKIALEMIMDAYKKGLPYSIVFIDNNMPLMTGIEVMQNVREFERDNNLSGLYAVSTTGDSLNLTQEGKDFDYYVGKPFHVAEIREILYKKGKQ